MYTMGYSGDMAMKKLAEDTGGRVIDVGNNGKKLEGPFAQMKRSCTQYVASYTPTNAKLDRKLLRKIDVECKGDGLKALARKGYYAIAPSGLMFFDNVPSVICVSSMSPKLQSSLFRYPMGSPGELIRLPCSRRHGSMGLPRACAPRSRPSFRRTTRNPLSPGRLDRAAVGPPRCRQPHECLCRYASR